MDKDKAVLVGVNLKSNTLSYASLDELKDLALAINIETCEMFLQNLERIDPKYYVGKGKLAEIKHYVETNEIDIVICDDTLTPNQLTNLESILEVQVIDRAFLILQIFSERAKTRQSILEVSLAQKRYMLPRLLGMGKVLSRQGGGSFNAKGPGETKLELDRRRLTDEIHQIKLKLKEITKKRNLSVKKRQFNEIPVVAIVGYTNAGKSSLLNYFTKHWGADKNLTLEEDMLFATVDTKAKRIQKENSPAFIMIDTVGFISKLPNELIASFESTFSDIKSADLIIHVIDGLNTDYAKTSFVNTVLKDLNLNLIPRITVVSKSDLVDEKICEKCEDALQISTKTGENIENLYREIESIIHKDARIYSLIIPFAQSKIFSTLKETTTVLESHFQEDGIHIKVLLTPKEAEGYSKLISN